MRLKFVCSIFCLMLFIQTQAQINWEKIAQNNLFEEEIYCYFLFRQNPDSTVITELKNQNIFLIEQQETRFLMRVSNLNKPEFLPFKVKEIQAIEINDKLNEALASGVFPKQIVEKTTSLLSVKIDFYESIPNHLMVLLVEQNPFLKEKIFVSSKTIQAKIHLFDLHTVAKFPYVKRIYF